MRALRRFLARLTAFATRRRDERRLRDELEAHLALHVADNVRAGMSAAGARRDALLKLGGVDAIREQYRDERGLPVLDNLLQDVKYGLRQLRKAPLFTLAAVLSLAMGIGANVTVFAVIERVLLKSLPVPDPQQLVFLADQRGEGQGARFSYPFYADIRDNDVLNGTAAAFSLGVATSTNGQTSNVSGELVSGNYFRVVGADTQVGRPLTPEDDRVPGAHLVAVLGDGFWRREFGSDPSVVGRGVHVNNRTYTIVGVAARGFTGTDMGSSTDIWLPMAMQREVGRDLMNEARTNWLQIIGRLQPDMSLERASAGLATYRERRPALMQAGPAERRLELLPGDKGNGLVRRDLGPSLRVLQALTLLALMLACVNVASLLAVRSAAREKEIAVRLAIGARRSRLAQQFLTEATLLAAAGGAAALMLAPWAARLLVAAQPYRIEFENTPDVRVLLFAVVVSAVSALIVGQAPILLSRRVGLTTAFLSASPTPLYRRVTLHDGIVSFQIGASLAMLISAALLLQSLRSLGGVDPGFVAGDVIVMAANPAAVGHDGDRLREFWRRTLERVGRVPGVQSASVARIVPLAAGRMRQHVFVPAAGDFVEIDANVVGPRYFRTLGIPVVRGREFDDRDSMTSRSTVIVNERFAAALWPGEDPLGKVLRVKGLPGSPDAEVVGLVRDVKYRDLRGEFGPMFYRPFLQSTSSDTLTLHVRASGDRDVLIAAIRRELEGLDRSVPVFAVTTLAEQLSASFGQTRQAAVLAGVFGVLALLLSGIGVYGVTALAVSRRTRDIGIRIALGAERRHIVGVVGWRALALVIAGLGLGVMGSLAFTRIAAALLYGVTARDAATFAAMTAVLALVSAVAFWLPMRAATRVDAVTAIRTE
jgi:predicted permease